MSYAMSYAMSAVFNDYGARGVPTARRWLGGLDQRASPPTMRHRAGPARREGLA